MLQVPGHTDQAVRNMVHTCAVGGMAIHKVQEGTWARQMGKAWSTTCGRPLTATRLPESVCGQLPGDLQ